MIPCKNHPDRPAVPRKDGGPMGRCRECLQATARAAAKAKRKKAPGPDGNGRESPPAEAGKKVMLDFSPHPEIFSRIREKAKENFRTVENEILFLLRTV